MAAKSPYLTEVQAEKASTARKYIAVFLAVFLAVVLLLAYIPLMRIHGGWEDEVYWASTCLSILRHHGAVPSVLVDYPRPFSPPHLYGPTMFWLASGVLRVFGFSMRTWRSFTFAGDVAYFAAVAVLFYRLRRSRAIALGAALFCALSLSVTFGLSLPGRPDSWTLALVVAAFTVAIEKTAETRARTMQWLVFGALLALAASTTPRVWSLVGITIATLGLRVGKGWLRAVSTAAASFLTVWSLLLWPLHMTLWQFVSSVRHASAGDAVDVSPLLGGRWGFSHAHTQAAYFGALLLVICVVDLTRWRQVARFQRWLIAVGMLNMIVTMLLTARAFNMTTYWGFVIELVALYAWTEPATKERLRVAWTLGALLAVCMVFLRASREITVFMQWGQRDPRLVTQEFRTFIPSGAVVYGPSGEFFYPSLSAGADYRHPVDWASKGRASTPGQPNLPTPMRDACRAPAFLVWPAGEDAPPFPPMPHATAQFVTRYQPAPAALGGAARWLLHALRTPGDDAQDFAIYRLKLQPEYCQSLEFAAAR